jgi:hypothetical protein
MATIRSTTVAVVVSTIVLTMTGCGSSGGSTPDRKGAAATSAGPATLAPLPSFGPGDTYRPVYDRTSFTADVTNPWFPLRPGSTMLKTGTKDGEASRDVFSITSETKAVDGVVCRVIRHKLFLSGVLYENTIDYYTQDRGGDVWYFGEDTETLDKNGHVTSTDGTWHAGENGAQPGVFMPAEPQVGQRYRQEYYRGHAEDQFKVLTLSASVAVPNGTYDHVLRTEETTATEPGIVDNKYYVRGIGEVEEVQVQGDGPSEKAVLTQIQTS